MHTAILRLGILLTLAALGTAAATAQTELFFATGVDSTGRALAQSNADGHVLIESPQYPHGLWLHLANEAGDALTGIRVEYQGRPDSLVAIHCVDPVGEMQETLVWTRADGTLLRLILKPSDATDLPAGLVSIDWQIDPTAEALLELEEETRLEGWEAVAVFLRERWQDQAGRVAVQLDTSTLAVHPDSIETLVAHLKEVHRPAGISPVLYAQVFRGDFASLQGGVILYLSLFADANLERVVRERLGRPQGRLTPEDVASLTALSASSKDIHSLAGIEHLAALWRLDLFNNRITHLTPLADLNNLNELYMGYNQIVDITPLANLNNLNELYMGNNQIVDITPLNQLNNLNELYMGYNQIVDITPLNQLNNLNRLYLSSNQIVDITPLNQLNNLTILTLGDNQIADITPLNQLNNLTILDLFNNQIVDITPLTDLNNLNRLYLSFNQIADITPLNQLNNLNRLDLYCNQIINLTPLANLNKLKTLSLSRNQIADLTPLANLNKLKTLSLSRNQITHLTPLAFLADLNSLGLGSNQIVDITPLNQLSNLQWLNLEFNQIVDITPLKQLNNLKTLRLFRNRIENLAPLIVNAGLGKGDEVGLSGNPLNTQSRNEHIPALQARGVTVHY